MARTSENGLIESPSEFFESRLPSVAVMAYKSALSEIEQMAQGIAADDDVAQEWIQDLKLRVFSAMRYAYDIAPKKGKERVCSTDLLPGLEEGFKVYESQKSRIAASFLRDIYRKIKVDPVLKDTRRLSRPLYCFSGPCACYPDGEYDGHFAARSSNPLTERAQLTPDEVGDRDSNLMRLAERVYEG